MFDLFDVNGATLDRYGVAAVFEDMAADLARLEILVGHLQVLAGGAESGAPAVHVLDHMEALASVTASRAAVVRARAEMCARLVHPAAAA